MKLKVKNRLILPSVLPQQGDYKTLVIKQDIIDKVKISQEEMKEIDFRVDNNGYKWDDKKAKENDIEFTELEIDLIKAQLSELDKKKQLDDNTIVIYKLFNS